MERATAAAPLAALLVLLVAVLYPALVLDAPVTPEDSLKTMPPWREQVGPHPAPSTTAVHAATDLGPRLQVIRREGLAAALWNPWVGGGRPGWLSSPSEGGAPLVLLAVALTRPGHEWTGLVALQLVSAFLGAWWVARRAGTDGRAAALAGLAYALSGAAAAHWLDGWGSAHALAPWTFWPALAPARRLMARASQWAIVAALIGACGPPAAPVFAAAVAFALVAEPRRAGVATVAAVATGIVIAGLLLAPRAWLQVAGAEPAGQRTARPGPAIASLAALVDPAVPPSGPDRSSGAAAGSEGFLSTLVLGLAAIGAAAGSIRSRAVWTSLFVLGLVLVAVPEPLIAPLGLRTRPWALLALAAAVLAAAGLDTVRRRLAATWRAWAAAAGILACLASLVPAAAARLPFAHAAERRLEVPTDLPRWPAGPRTVGLLGTMPPDLAMSWSLADVRAADLGGEPLYAALLGVQRGSLTAARALSPRIAGAGAGVLLEPQTAHLVSAEAFGRAEVVEIPSEACPAGRACKVAVTLPAGVTRIGIGGDVRPSTVRLVSQSRTAELPADQTLASESTRWHWFAVPEGWPPGPATLALAPSPEVAPREIALDSSGLRMLAETQGVRAWRWSRARAIARVVPPVPPGGAAADGGWLEPDAVPGSGARVSAPRPDTLLVEVRAPAAATLALLVKYRPALWHVEVDGSPVRSHPLEDVWTGVPVPEGASLVTVRARLPVPVALAALVGILLLACTAGCGWRRG